MALPGIGQYMINPAQHHPFCPSSQSHAPNCRQHLEIAQASNSGGGGGAIDQANNVAFYPLSAEALKAIDGIEYITDHLRMDEEYKTLRNDWKYVAMVIDRFLLYVFFGVTLGGTLGILLSAPYVFHSVDQKAELTRIIGLYKSGGQLY